MSPEELVQAALDAAVHAHVPYSEFPVGAALVTADGRVVTGCNVENASYGLTLCAERVAIHSAVAAGPTRVVALAVCSRPGASLCGACRQVLAEFADDKVPVYLSDATGAFRTTSLGVLLPEAFRGEGLRGDDEGPA